MNSSTHHPTTEPHKPPPTLSSLEAENLLTEFDREHSTCRVPKIRDRNYTMALLMLDAGLRVGELVHLAHSDLCLNDQPAETLLIRSEIAKNKNERTVPLSLRLRRAIKQMDETWWTRESEHPYLYAFYSSNPGLPLTTRQVERIIKRAGTHAIGRDIHPHVLRHTFASRLMRTTNIRVVQELLGHKQLSSTQIYTHPNQEDKRNAIDRMEKGTQNAVNP